MKTTAQELVTGRDLISRIIRAECELRIDNMRIMRRLDRDGRLSRLTIMRLADNRLTLREHRKAVLRECGILKERVA